LAQIPQRPIDGVKGWQASLLYNHLQRPGRGQKGETLQDFETFCCKANRIPARSCGSKNGLSYPDLPIQGLMRRLLTVRLRGVVLRQLGLKASHCLTSAGTQTKEHPGRCLGLIESGVARRLESIEVQGEMKRSPGSDWDQVRDELLTGLRGTGSCGRHW
jgi:hypothetical protein